MLHKLGNNCKGSAPLHIILKMVHKRKAGWSWALFDPLKNRSISPYGAHLINGGIRKERGASRRGLSKKSNSLNRSKFTPFKELHIGVYRIKRETNPEWDPTLTIA